MRWRAGAALCLAWLGSAAAAGFAQDPSARLEQIRAEIQAREARAQELSRSAETLLAKLEAIDNEIVEARRSQKQLSTRQSEAVAELKAAREAATEAGQQMERIERELGPRLVALYKFTATGGLPALYSERDFQSSLRVRDGLSKILAADAAVFARYETAQQESKRRSAEAEALVNEIVITKQEYGTRRELERLKRVERRNVAGLMRQRAVRESQAAEELRQAAARLEREIGNLPQNSGSGEAQGLVQGALLSPVKGKIRTEFGIETDPEFNTRIRSGGIEIGAELGADVRAVAAGRVVYAGAFRGYGQVIIVDHGADSLTVSGYLDELAVGVDDRVQKGQVIGKVGDSGARAGPGLYFELRRNGKPVDPIPWFAPETEGKS